MKFYWRAFTELLPAFHNQHLSCANESLRLRLTLRKEGWVAGLESPNGLGATLNCQANKSMSIPIALFFGHLSARGSVQRRAPRFMSTILLREARSGVSKKFENLCPTLRSSQSPSLRGYWPQPSIAIVRSMVTASSLYTCTSPAPHLVPSKAVSCPIDRPPPRQPPSYRPYRGRLRYTAQEKG